MESGIEIERAEKGLDMARERVLVCANPFIVSRDTSRLTT